MIKGIDEELVAAAWDGNAVTWTEHVRAGFDRYRELFTWPAFVGLLPEGRGLEVIDLGCGEGENTRRIARLGARMTGVDLSPRMIAAAREVEASEPLGISYESGSFARLEGFADASFDAAVSTMALMDNPNLADAFRAAYRVLRPGGTLTFSVLHPCFMTTGAGWLRDQDDRETHLTVADYFSDTPDIEHWRFSKAPHDTVAGTEPFTVPRFRHRLADYVNGLADAGFRIEQLMEPRPGEEEAMSHPWLRRWRRHAALVLMIRSRRPAE
jgi:ubiquinone/menaquinone biosynthesis C-methylase UbiE